MKRIKKHLSIMKIVLKNQAIYRFNLFASCIFPIFYIFLYLVIWNAIFSSNKDKDLGFSFGMMITYYIIVSLFSRWSSFDHIAISIASDIKNGEFSKYLIRPLKLVSFYFTSCISIVFLNILISIFSLSLWILIFSKYFVFPNQLQDLISSIPLLFLGIFWLMQSNFLISLLALWLDEVYAFFHIKRTLFGFLMGEFVPLSLFPASFLFIFKFLPFYYIFYFPIEIYLGKENNNILMAYLCLIAWNVSFYFINNIVYKKAIKTYSGVSI